MKKVLKAVAVIGLLAAVAGLILFFGVLPRYVAGSLNKTISGSPYQVSDRAKRLHSKLFVADLHADSLLWGYDLNKRQEQNHFDLPRAIEGNVALQAFTVVTKTPRGLNIERNTNETDNLFWLSFAQRQPIGNLASLTSRALYQAERLNELATKSEGKLIIVSSKGDLSRFVTERKSKIFVGGWLGIEGAHALDGDIENLDRLFDAGFRMMSPSHFFDTDIGGSAHGIEKHGLTEMGKELIRRMEQKGMLVDIAHASEKTFDDVVVISTRPLVVSHTGVRGTCDNNRNLSDAQLRKIADTGGVIGIGFWETAVCGSDAKAIARAIKYAVGVAGIDHVGLGSDYDGAVTVPFDVAGMPLITEALIEEGFSDEDIAKIMGGNILRLLSISLPD